MNLAKQFLPLLASILFTINALTFPACTRQPPHEENTLQAPPISLGAPVFQKKKSPSLPPGLSVRYVEGFYRSIDQMPESGEMRSTGRKGRPIPLLNHVFGKDEEVFNSGRPRGIGMLLSGYLFLPQPGTYRFQALANDGIEFLLDHKLLLTDPGVHKARLSPTGMARVAGGGWFPLQIRYFQRKGTAALKLYWQPPGSTHWSIVPREMYAHAKDRDKQNRGGQEQ